MIDDRNIVWLGFASVIVFLLLGFDLLHKFHAQRISVLHDFDWLLFVLLTLLLNRALLQFAGFFSLGLFLGLLFAELLLGDDVLFLQLFVLAEKILFHRLKVVALQLHRPRLNRRTGNCKLFTALFGHFLGVNTSIAAEVLKLLRPETVVMKFFLPRFLTSMTMYFSFSDFVFASLDSFSLSLPSSDDFETIYVCSDYIQKIPWSCLTTVCSLISPGLLICLIFHWTLELKLIKNYDPVWWMILWEWVTDGYQQ